MARSMTLRMIVVLLAALVLWRMRLLQAVLLSPATLARAAWGTLFRQQVVNDGSVKAAIFNVTTDAKKVLHPLHGLMWHQAMLHAYAYRMAVSTTVWQFTVVRTLALKQWAKAQNPMTEDAEAHACSMAVCQPTHIVPQACI